MSVALSGWRKPLPVHGPAKVVLDLAVTLALSGDCLDDIALLPVNLPLRTCGLGCDGLAHDDRQCSDESGPTRSASAATRDSRPAARGHKWQ